MKREVSAGMSRATYIFRWDDISPRQDRRKFRALVDLFVKYDVPAVLGVIPDNRDESIAFESQNENEFVAELHELEKAGWEIAQHGYRHLKHTDNGGILRLNPVSEFAGRGHSDQFADIDAGRQILIRYGFSPVTFIAPWHSYDCWTLKALADADFRILSDGMFLYPRMVDSLLQLPMIFWTAPRRTKILERLEAVYTICLHPHLLAAGELGKLEHFFRTEHPRVVVPSSLLVQRENLTKRGFKKRLLEVGFSIYFRRQG